MGTANGLGTSLAQAERANFAFPDQLRHGADRILNGHGRIDPVLVVEIDDLDAQALEARLACAQDVFGPAIGDLAAPPAKVAELGRQNHLGATLLDRLADEFFIMAEAVHVGGVEQRNAAIQGLMDQSYAVLIAARAVDAGERHAAQPDRRDFDAGRT